MDHPIVVLRTRKHLSRTELAQRAEVRRGTVERAESAMGVGVRSGLRRLRPDRGRSWRVTPRAALVAALQRLARLADAVARDLPEDVHPDAVRLVARACDVLDGVRLAARRGEP